MNPPHLGGSVRPAGSLQVIFLSPKADQTVGESPSEQQLTHLLLFFKKIKTFQGKKFYKLIRGGSERAAADPTARSPPSVPLVFKFGHLVSSFYFIELKIN